MISGTRLAKSQAIAIHFALVDDLLAREDTNLAEKTYAF
jgi:hypothetical protein